MQWTTDDGILVCYRYVETNPDEYLAVGRVLDIDTDEPTGDLFILIERNEEVLQTLQAPVIVFERLLSMIDVLLNKQE